MRSLRVSCVLLVTLVLFSPQIVAAESGTPPFDWTGPYAGLHLGYGRGNFDSDFTPLPGANKSGLLPAQVGPDGGGFEGGIQAGYNYQIGCVIAGIEADFSGSAIGGSSTSAVIGANGAPAAGVGPLTVHQSINWFGTVRPRIGYTMTPTILIYATGGLAFGNISSSSDTGLQPSTPVYYHASSNDTNIGWTVGGGVEWALSKHWSAKAEYLFVDLGSQSALAGANTPTQVGCKWDTKANILNFGVNYKF